MDQTFPSDDHAPHDQIAELTQQLREQDATIVALTEYLEYAAGRLEAADLPVEPPPSAAIAFPPEMVERQWVFSERLLEIVEQWHQADTPTQIAQLGEEVAAVRRAAARWFDVELGRTPAANERAPGFLLAQMRDEPAKNEKPATLSWAALKAEMLGEEFPPEEHQPHTDTKNADNHVDLEEELEILANRPEPVIAETATLEDWQEATDERDRYLASLIRTLRVMDARRRGSVDWATLEGVPEEQRQRLAGYENTLHQKLRSGEVELSMERARVGRLESRLRQRQSELEKALKQQPTQSTESDEAGSQNRRWMRFLNRAREDGAS